MQDQEVQPVSGSPKKLSGAEIERIKRAYPDPDGDDDPEPHEWADGILGEWANGAVQPIRAHNGDIKAAAYADLDRLYGEWVRRGEAIQKLLAHLDALQAENRELRRVRDAALELVRLKVRTRKRRPNRYEHPKESSR